MVAALRRKAPSNAQRSAVAPEVSQWRNAAQMQNGELDYNQTVPRDVIFEPVEGRVAYCSQYGPQWCPRLSPLCHWDAKSRDCLAMSPTW